MSIKYQTILVITLLLTGCGPSTPANTPTPSATPSPVSTSTPTATFTPSSTPTLIPPIIPGTALPDSKTITLGNVGEMTELAHWGSEALYANDIIYSPDGKTFVAATAFGIHFYDAETFETTNFIQTESAVARIDYAPDGSSLSVGLYNGVILVVNVIDEIVKWKFDQGKDINYVNEVIYSPDGKYLAGRVWDSVYLWQVDSGVLNAILYISPSPYDHSMAFSPDSTLLAIGTRWNGVELFHVSNRAGEHLDESEFVGSGGKCQACFYDEVYFSLDGNSILTFGGRETAIWNIPEKKITYQKEYDSFQRIAFSISRETVAVVPYSRKETVQLWDNANDKMTKSLEGHTNSINNLAFSPDGGTLATSSFDGTIRFWQISNGELVHTLGNNTSPSITAMAFSPNNQYLAVGTANGTLKLLDIDNGEPLWSIPIGNGGPLRVGVDPFAWISRPYFDVVWSVEFSPYDSTLVTGSESGAVRVWSVSDGKKEYEPQVPNQKLAGVWSVAFSPDGDSILWGERLLGIPQGDVLLRKQGQPIVKFQSHEEAVNSVAFSPDGLMFASGAGDQTVKLWQLDTKKIVQNLSADEVVFCIAISPDGKLIAAGLEDGKIKVWQVLDGKLLYTLSNGNSIVFDVAFSPDGNFLTAGSAEPTVKLWNVTDGSLAITLNIPKDLVRNVDFSPDGRLLATGSYNGVVRIWGIR